MSCAFQCREMRCVYIGQATVLYSYRQAIVLHFPIFVVSVVLQCYLHQPRYVAIFFELKHSLLGVVLGI